MSLSSRPILIIKKIMFIIIYKYSEQTPVYCYDQFVQLLLHCHNLNNIIILGW